MKYRIGDYFSFQNGYAFKSKDFSSSQNGTVIIKIKEFKDNQIDFDSGSARIIDSTPYLQQYGVKTGDILFALTGDPISRSNPNSWVGRVARYEKSYCALLNQRTCKAIQIKDGLEPDYLYYFFCDMNNLLKLAAKATGSASQANISTKIIENTIIDAPNCEQQKRIINFLNSINAKISYNRRINDNLVQQAESIFAHEFLMIDTIPDGWKKSSLLGIAKYLNGLAMQKYRPNDDEQGLPVLKIRELRQGFCDANSELCSPSIESEYIIHDGDVIFSWSGSLLVDLWCGGTCGLNQHLFKVTSSTCDKWFYYSWTNHHLQKFAAIAADMATTMGHIKRGELEKAEVLIPSQSDYDRIGGLLAPLYDLIISNRIENRKLASLRDELLPKLLSGELDVLEAAI